ncbi:MAG: DNA-processing protein DprA [Pseudomonadota bacterium]
MALDAGERMARLALARSGGIGPMRFQELLAECGSASAALAQLPGLMQRARLKTRKVATAAEAQREVAALEQLGGQMIVWGDKAYPPQLAEIRDPPPAIAVIGHAELLSGPMIAIVGARNASAAARRWTEDLARELGEKDFIVVSGMARGIDAAAHTGSLPTGTVAVLAGGIDHIYPPENEALYGELKTDGAIVTEQPLGLTPRSGHFPRRNRLVAGLAQGVIVVEATRKSGALITARLAAEEGREVFAVPGSPRDPRARGPNHLIRQGAILTEGIDDIVEALARPEPRRIRLDAGDETTHETGPIDQDSTPADTARRILDCLSTTPVEVDEIVRRCQVTAADAQTMLLELELEGRIERHPGNKISLA